MTAKYFFDGTPADWKELEEMVCQAFIEMGYKASREYSLGTVRGSVNIDVHALKSSTPIPTLILCECKHWNKRVPQNVVHGFRTVCADAGAHFGLIISKRGFQPGAESSRSNTNIHLMNFGQFQQTFFSEWQAGAFMLLARMRDQLLPVLRASAGYTTNGLDLVDKDRIIGIDVWRKYSIFFAVDGAYSQLFIGNDAVNSFPVTFPDPRGDPRSISSVIVTSHREYFDVARQAVVDSTIWFDLPRVHFSDEGKLLT